MTSKISSLMGDGPAASTVTSEFDSNELLDGKIEDHERLKRIVSPQEEDKSVKVGTDKSKKKEGTDVDAIRASENEDLETFEVLLQLIPYYGQGDLANDSLVRSTLSSLSVEDIDLQDEDNGNTLLILACQYGCEDLVRIMLSKGADPNAVNKSGACCLHFACYRESASYNIAKILLQNGANPDVAEFSFGITPLHYCAANGDIEFCKLILSYGARINAYDSYNYNCVDYAREAGFDEVASFLQKRLDKFNSQNPLRTGFGSAKNLEPKGNSAYDDMNEWESNVDPATGEKYYINLSSGECLWEREIKQRLMNPQNTQGMQRQFSMHADPSSDLLQHDAIIGETDLETNRSSLDNFSSQGKKEWGRSKIMLVGEGRAGKTALANSILGRKYESTDSTVGINAFTVNVSYASIGSDHNTHEKRNQWLEYHDHKRLKEYEMAFAKLISDKKAGRVQNNGVKTEDDVDILLKARNKGGYVEREKVNLMTSSELEMLVVDKSLKERAAHDREPSKGDHHVVAASASKPHGADAPKGDVAPRSMNQTKSHQKTEETVAATDVDQSLVMQYLGEKTCADSKFIVSVFDFGGQSVFNVIHPFFLTRFGVYVVVFNMEWLSNGASPNVKEDCLNYMTFWLNSIIIHTQNEKEQVAPIFFVGTRKDVITSPAEHLQISTKIYEVFSGSLAWPYVIENLGAEGPNGKTDLCFYPVNNTMSHQDETVQKLLRKIEETIDESSYVHVQRPLSWFRVLDAFKEQQVPYLKYDDAKSIIMNRGIPEKRVSLLLQFFHEMGILMWHDEDKLRDVVVFDPIEYFVKPATIVICKHVPDEADGIHHVLDIHRLVRKQHGREFQEMTKHGIVTEKLLQALLQGHEQNYGHIRQLMLKYGLLVSLTLQDKENENHKEQAMEQEVLYLAPALLPEAKKNSEVSYNLSQGSISTQFYFLFTPSNELEHMTTISLQDCQHLGFLPHGLFEKLISAAIMWSMKTSDFLTRTTLHGCYKNAAELAFGNQTFRIFADPRHHLISVIVDGKNPVGVHDRLVDQLKEIIAQCLKSLKFITVLRYSGGEVKGDAREAGEDTLLFVRLDQIRAVVEKKTALSLNVAGGRGLLSANEAMRVYGPWLVDYTVFDEYDMFISYRWGVRDSDFTLALFDRMTLYSVEDSRRPIRAFLDRKRLKVGENFQSGFLKALLRSLVMVPVVSAEGLDRMTRLTEKDEDNVLIEWICGLECMKAAVRGEKGSKMMKIMPVFFGRWSDRGDQHIGNLFQEKIIDQLPSIVPVACLVKAKSLLASNKIVVSEEFLTRTVKEIVEEVCKYLFLCAWDVPASGKKSLISHTAERIVPELETALSSVQHLRATRVEQKEGLSASSAILKDNIQGVMIESNFESLSLSDLKEMIKKDLKLSTSNMQEIMTEAFENLTEEEQEQVKAGKSARERALLVAKFLGIL